MSVLAPREMGARGRLNVACVSLALISSAHAEPVPDSAIKFNCDRKAGEVTVIVDGSSPGEPSKLGRFAGDLDLDKFPPHRPRLICRIRPGFAVSIIPLISVEQPRNNNVLIVVNGVIVERVFWNLGQLSKLTVSPNPGLGLAVFICRWSYGPGDAVPDVSKQKPICQGSG